MKKLITGSVLLVVTLPAFIGVLAWGILQFPDPEPHRVPGRFELTVPEAGSYVIWHHYRATFEGRRYELPESLPHGARIEITALPGGRPLAWRAHDGGHVQGPGGARRSVGRRELEPGRYRVTVDGFDEARVISLAPGFAAELLILIGVGFATLIGGLGLGTLLVIIGAVQLAARHSSPTASRKE